MSADVPPLDGLVVLDFTRVLAGPYCTRLMADLGARVIKIERPGQGDDTRAGYLQLEDGRDDQSTYFVRANAGKESVGLDLWRPEAREVVRDLARIADVVVENFVPDVVTRLGCDYETLAAMKPDLVYCSISGYGQTGPWRLRPAFAHLIHAASGLMSLEQGSDGIPRPAHLQAADVLAGTHAFGAILAALWRRSRTGQGARLDISMLETLVAAEDVTFGSALNGGEVAAAPRAGMIVKELHGRHLAVQTVGGSEIWNRLTTLMEQPELTRDPRFATPRARRLHWPELRDLVDRWLDRFDSVEEAVDVLTRARVPCAPVLTPDEVMAHPHLEARRFFAAIPHPARGTVRVTGTPFQLDGHPLGPQGPAPYRVGEHSRAVLEGLLGYAPARVDTLVAQGAVATP